MTLKTFKPFAWQQRAITEATKRALGIAAAPGAGKTLVALTVAANRIQSGQSRRVAIVAPSALLEHTWAPEAHRWDHLTKLDFDLCHRFSGATREAAWFNGTGNIITVTPDTLAKFAAAVAARGVIPIDAIVIDESHMFADPTSERARALLLLSKVLPHVLLLSGTFTPNGPINGYTPGRALSTDPFWSESFFKWRNTHFTKRGNFSFVPKPTLGAAITKALAKVAISIRLEDAADVPSAIYSDFYFDHDPDTREAILTFMRDKELKISADTVAGEDDGAFLMKLAQLSNGFFYRDDKTARTLSMARVKALKDVIEQAEGSQVLVFVRFKEDVAMIRRAYPKAEVFTGATKDQDRAEIIERWNSNRIGGGILLGSPASMGVGLNLQHSNCRTAVWYSQTFSHAQKVQSEARLVRVGQKQKISIVTLKSAIGIDNAMSAVLARKLTGEAALMAALNINQAKKAA